MRNYILLYFCFFLPNLVMANNPWTRISESSISLRTSEYREIVPEKYSTFSINEQELRSSLSLTRDEQMWEIADKVSISLPMPDGRVEKFIIWRAPQMEAGISARYPSIQSYKGYQQNKKQNIARFTLTDSGLHGAINTPEGMIYIDPYSNINTGHYISYYTQDHHDQSITDRTLCGTDDLDVVQQIRKESTTHSRNIGDKIEMRTYRLALGCTGEWGAKRATKEAALAEMVTFVERANIVFETELAIRLVIIDKNDELIFLDGSVDPYSETTKGLSLVGQNTNILNGRVGGANYDVGHLFSVCYDVGGVAAGRVCTPGKGAGVTCHNGSAVSTGIVLVFNHEVGHQMTASHTFNHCGDTDQLAFGTAFEPGSGSTIMAYPGACGSDNLGAPRDAYYHVASLEQMLGYTNTEVADAYICADKIDINNYIPKITLPYKNGFYIPQSTPFFLTGAAEDENGDAMTYIWEQFDNGSSSPLGSPTGNAPLFRSIKPSTSPTRFFPNQGDLLAGRFTSNAELLPTYGRDLNFRFVVRDNNPLGNAAVWEDLQFKVAPDAGPFKLTYPFLDYKFKVGQEITVTWDVANTDIAPINCKEVDIYLALNNSLDFNSENLILVANAIPNDGSENIIIPNNPTIRARVVIKAHDNIFLPTSTFNSYIEIPTYPTFFMDVVEDIQTSCLPESVSYQFSTLGFEGLDSLIHFEVVSGLPDGAIATFSSPSVSPGASTTLNLALDQVSGTQDFDILVRSFAVGIDTIERTIRLKITSNDLANIALTSPEENIKGVGPTQIYSWSAKEDATSYRLEVATSPNFLTENLVITLNTTSILYASNIFLDKATVYYWRVRGENSCGVGAWSAISAFSTESLTCQSFAANDLPINISGSGMPTVSSIVPVNIEGTISDINIKSIVGDHAWAGDLDAYLISPSGQEVNLLKRKCGSSKGFSIGIDDQSNQFFQCPINTGKIYRPESPLSAFNGESMKGNWTIRLDDKASGNGGKLSVVEIELCANISQSPPSLTRNEILQISPKDIRDIDRILLLTEDDNNTATELRYTLVAGPQKGMLITNGNSVLQVGDAFTQSQIDGFQLRYQHTADDLDDDHFFFDVSDGQGGWVGITKFRIDVDVNFPSGVEDLAYDDQISIYPNPTSHQLQINILQDNHRYTKYAIFNVNGQQLFSSTINGPSTIVNTESLKSGVYVIQVYSSEKSVAKKVIKQ